MPMQSDLQQAIHDGRIVEGMNFNQKVWAMCARVPRGKVVTYAQIAKALNSNGYRAVGNALNRNPYSPAVPCHRVVGSNGALTGFAGGIPKKRRMLAEEGVAVGDNGRVDVASDACDESVLSKPLAASQRGGA